MSSMKNREFGYLDGLRGVAALMVVVNHFAFGFLPAIKTGAKSDVHTRLDLLIYHSPLILFFAGNLAVCIFFVLSGFVLSYKFFATGEHEVVTSGAVRRYFRLLPPILGSIIVAYVLLRLGLFFNSQASRLTNSVWLGGFWQFPPSLKQALYQGFFGVLFKGVESYNTNLWTMQTEFFGSYLVFLMLGLFGKIRNRAWVYAVLAIVFWNTYYLAFLIGVAYSDVWASGNRDWIVRVIQKGWFVPALLTGLVLGAVPDFDAPANFAHMLEPKPLPYLQFSQLAHILAAALIIICLLSLPKLQKVFNTRVARYLGHISFSLYVVHLCVIGSLASFIFINLPHSIPYSTRVLITFIPSIVVVFAWATLFTRVLDQPAIKWAGSLYKRFFGNHSEATEQAKQKEATALRNSPVSSKTI